MIKNIFWKGFWKNRKNFSYMMLSGSLMNSIIYSTMEFEEYMVRVTSGKEVDLALEQSYLISFLVVYVLLFFVLLLSLTCYMRSRAREYGILELSGIRQKHRSAFIVKEFGMIFAGSLVGGFVLGLAETGLMGMFLKRLYPNEGMQLLNVRTILIVLAISVVEFGILFAVAHLRIACLGIQDALHMSQKAGKRPNDEPWKRRFGFLFCLISWIIMGTYWGHVNNFYLTVCMAVGLYLLFVSLGGWILSRMKHNEKKYYRKITWLSSWYHRFHGNIRMLYIVAVMTFIAMYSYAMPVFDGIPLADETYFPYDMVALTEEENETDLKKLENTYGIQVEKQSCINLTTPDFGEQIGISASDYEKLTGEKISLENDEVYIVYQRENAYRNAVGIDSGTARPRIHAGKKENSLWAWTPLGSVPSEVKFNTSYKIRGTTDRILTGVFGESYEWNVVVFSDECYAELQAGADGFSQIWMMNLPENLTEQAEKTMQTYAEQCTADGSTFHLFQKTSLLEEEREGNLLKITVCLMGFVLLSMCAVLVMIIKIGNDNAEIAEKYRFYRLMGMTETKIKRGIRNEYRLMIYVPICAGMVTGLISVTVELILRRFQASVFLFYLGGTIGMGACLIFVYGVICRMLAGRMIRKMERGF